MFKYIEDKNVYQDFVVGCWKKRLIHEGSQGMGAGGGKGWVLSRRGVVMGYHVMLVCLGMLLCCHGMACPWGCGFCRSSDCLRSMSDVFAGAYVAG